MKTTGPSICIILSFVCVELLPKVQAVSPPPDGGYADGNTAEGTDALFSLTIGTANTAIGFQALFSNTFGGSNMATGYLALSQNTTGSSNTANGTRALRNNTTGSENTACGGLALLKNTTGDDNVANGQAALVNNTTGHGNTATGYGALFYNTTGNTNTANGFQALYRNRTGNSNIALGLSAGSYLTTGSNNIDIGNGGVFDDSGTIRIGTAGTHTATFIAGISGSPITGTSVVVNSNGRLGTAASSQRFKDDIKPMDKASEAILALRPVTFHYKKEIDPEGIPQFGLVAEQVEKVNPDLVARDEEGKVYTVRYEAVNAMLLNEFLKEHRKVEQLEKQVEKLTAGLQKVSAHLEASKPAQQVVNNNQ
jgi:hypothetical protein